MYFYRFVFSETMGFAALLPAIHQCPRLSSVYPPAILCILADGWLSRLIRRIQQFQNYSEQALEFQNVMK